MRKQPDLPSGFNVSFDKLGATTASWAVVEHDLYALALRVDRSGVVAPIVETWPSAAWRRFTGTRENPATLDSALFEERLKPVVDFASGSWRALTESARPHVQDAVVCALVAGARAVGATELPGDDQREAATQEGWIHIPQAGTSFGGLLA